MDLTFFTETFFTESMTYFALFVIVALGYLFGRISIKGISLDISAIIFVAMYFGHLGIKLPSIISNVGLVLFIFTIGIQAGPGFFEAMKKDGIKLAALAVVMAIGAGVTAVGLGYLYGIDMDTVSGLLAGAMTSTPGLATASEIFDAGSASIGYGIAYPFGVIGIIFILRLLPKVLRINIEKKEQEWEAESMSDYPLVTYRNIEISNPNVEGCTLSQLNVRKMTGTNVSRIKHEDVACTPLPSTTLHKGDVLRVVGTVEALDQAEILLGKETNEEIPLSNLYEVRTLLVTNKNVVNKTLGELNLFSNYSATVTRIRRSGIDIVPSTQSKIRFADKVVVACDKDHMMEVEQMFGNQSKSLDKNDFLPIAVGIVLGVILGKLTPLGLTGGVLFTALILGRIGKTGPILWTMSGSANNVIRELGLILFLAVVGTEAGATIVQKFQEFGLSMFLIGAAITVVPMVLGILVSMSLLKLNFLSMLGALSGSMTSTPGLAAITPMSKTNAPQVAYATIYPIAMVALVVLIRVMAYFV